MAPDRAEPGPAPPRGWPRWLRWALAFTLLAALAGSAVPRWEALREHLLAFRPGWGAIALAGLAIANLVAVECWRRWLLGLGQPIAYPAAFRAMFLANLAKYLPGAGWHYVGRAALCARLGVPPEATAVSMLMDTSLHLATAAIVGVPLLAAGGGVLPLEAPWLIALAVLGLLALHPRLIAGALGLAARALGRPEVAVPYRYPYVLAMALLYAVNWLWLGLAFAAFGQAWLAVPLDLRQVALLAGALPCAWALGAVTLVAPAGLGVREAGLALLLAPAFPPGWPVLVALASRLWFMAVEAIAFGVAAAAPERPGR